LQIEALTHKKVGPLLEKLARECDAMHWAVAWARPNEVGDAAVRYWDKFEHLVIGTHFYQTSPDFLEEFQDVKAARMMLPTGATFHPKVYLFTTGGSTSAVVGSHNLTNAAFATNTEAGVLMKGLTTEPVMSDLHAFVRREWMRAKRIDEYLYTYKIQHLASEAARKSLETFNAGLKVRPPKDADTRPLEWTWDQYLKEVRKRNALDMEGRLEVLEGARVFYNSARTFSRLSPAQRKAVTGTFHKKEAKLDDKPWAWFGSMVGHGDFRKRVNTPSQHLVAAVDSIPLTGRIDEVHYRRFVSHLKRAFAGATHKADYAIATRLLAIRRPDRFVGINSRNERALCAAFGITRAHLDMDSYWDLVAVPISMARWWRSASPAAGLSRRIWEGRAALLDCVYYQPQPGDEP
jgi:hypothetical protein